MNSPRSLNPFRNGHSWLAAAVIAILMTFAAAAPGAHADDQFTKCRHHADKAEAKLDQAIAQHGSHSEEATEARQNLRKQREHCYERIHQWWDARKQKWERNDNFDKDLRHGDNDHDRDSR